MPNQYGDIAQSTAGPPVTMGPSGFWLDQDGNVAATDQSGKPQVTPGMRDNPQAATYYDAAKDLNYNVVNGTKVYQSPVGHDAQGNTIFKKSLKGGPISDTGGGALHGRPTWNPQTGTWDVGLDMGKVLSWAAAAGISAGVINAAMAGGAVATSGAGAAVSGSAPALEGLAAGGAGATTIPVVGAAPLASATIGSGAIGPIAGGTGATGLSDWARRSGLSGSIGDILRYGLPVAGNIAGGLIAANAQGKATDAQQKYLEEALTYQKEQDAYNRRRQAGLDEQNVSRYNYGRDQEASRYANYSGNIAPYVATGQTANARMANLLGLPASQVANPQQPVSPAAAGMKLTALQNPLSSQSQPGSITTQPLPRDASAPAEPMVTIQAPNGQMKQVPASQQQHWESVGGKVIGAAA